jgi:chromosome segregation ATPase
MSDEELVKRLRDRAKQDRLIQANNEAVATALMGQRLLFDQGHRSPSNTYAVRLAVDHDNCARQDAKLAADWDEAADRIEELTELLATTNEQLEAARADAKEAEAYAEELEKQLNICRMAQVVMENGIAEVEKERDDYAFKLADANNTYSEMHVALSEAKDKLATCEEIGRAFEEDAGQLREKLRARAAERNHANDVTDAAIEEVNRLKALLANLVGALRAAAQHEASFFYGPDAEKNKRASWRGVMRKVKAALAEIEGSNAP